MRLTLQSQILFNILLVSSLLTSICCVGAEEEDSPRIANRAKNKSGFVPKDWQIVAESAGDLNGDRVPDIALVIEQIQEVADPTATESSEEAPARCLIVSVRKKDQLLHKVFESWGIAPRGMDPGPLGGDTLGGLKITGERLVVNERDSGSYTEFENSISLATVGGKWNVVAASAVSIDKHCDPAQDNFPFRSVVEYDLKSGLVRKEYDPTILSCDDNGKTNPKPRKVERFYALRATYGNVLNENPTTSQALPLRLDQKNCLIRGAEKWTGTEDLSATLQSTCSDKEFVLVARIRDNAVTAEDKVSIVDSNGRSIKPASESKQTIPGGYLQINHYLRSQLHYDKPTTLNDGWFLAAVQVSDSDTPGRFHCLLSTAIHKTPAAAIAVVCEPLIDASKPTSFQEIDILPRN